MKKYIYVLLIFTYSLVHGQKALLKLGENPYNMNSKATLEIESTTKGFLPPRMNSAQRDNIATPPQGLTLYNTDNKTLEVNNGTSFRGTTASGFYFMNMESNILLQNDKENVFYVSGPSINNEFDNITKSPFFSVVAPSDGWYLVNINYTFNSSPWSVTDTCYTGLYVGTSLRARIDHTVPSGTRFVSYSCSTAVRLLKNEVLKPVVYYYTDNTTSDKTIDYCNISIVKL